MTAPAPDRPDLIVTVPPPFPAGDEVTSMTEPLGIWQVEITPTSDDPDFAGGAPAGQPASGLILLTPDHRLLSLLPGPGAGNWRCDDGNTLSLEFTELFGYRPDGTFTAYAVVTQTGTLSADGSSFLTSGQGVLWRADGTPITTTPTTARAVRVTQPVPSAAATPPADKQSTARRLGAHRYVRLTTFRRSGEPVGTAVWVVEDGDRLLVWTGDQTGKVRRLRHTARVTVAPATGRGKPQGDAVEGTGRILPYDQESQVRQLVRAKYGLAFHALGLLNRLALMAGRSKSSRPVAVEITLGTRRPDPLQPV